MCGMTKKRMGALLAALLMCQSAHTLADTKVSISQDRWLINGQPTNPGTPCEGLLMNVRMVNATLEDLSGRRPEFDAAANTDEFIKAIPAYAAHGVNAFTLCLSGEPIENQPASSASTTIYFPPPESQGGWRAVETDDEIETIGGMDKAKIAELSEWLLKSDNRPFAAVVIRRGTIVLQVERGNSAATDSRRVASVSKAICATVLAIASERSQQGLTPRRMTFEDKAFDFIPWALPLSDPRKADITVKQLLNHTSGICPEAVGAANDGTWDYILGHSGDRRTAKLAFDPGTGCGYSTHALVHASLVCETVTGKPYDEFAIEALFKPLGIEKWWFQYYEGGKVGRKPSHGLGLPARAGADRLLHVARRPLERQTSDSQVVRRANRATVAQRDDTRDALEAEPGRVHARLGTARQTFPRQRQTHRWHPGRRAVQARQRRATDRAGPQSRSGHRSPDRRQRPVGLRGIPPPRVRCSAVHQVTNSRLRGKLFLQEAQVITTKPFAVVAILVCGCAAQHAEGNDATDQAVASDEVRLAPPAGRIDMVLDSDMYNEVDDQFALAYSLQSADRINLQAVCAAPFLNHRSKSAADGLAAATNIASALILDPSIAERVVVVWIGGHPHDWPHARDFNLTQDIAAAQVLFDCGVPLIHIPAGTWTVSRDDTIAKEKVLLATDASGRFVFDSPASRAVLFHFKRTGP